MFTFQKLLDVLQIGVVFTLAILLCCFGGLSTCHGDGKVLEFRTVPSDGSVSHGNFLLLPDSFSRLGTWQIQGDAQALAGQVLFGQIDLRPEATVSAGAMVTIPTAGRYRVWVRCREFQTKRPGVRFFDVHIGKGLYEGRFADEGLHEGYGWEDGGIVELPTGETSVEVIDSSAEYVRCDAIFLTPDLEMPPANTFSEVAAHATVIRARRETQATFPELAGPDATPTRTEEIANEKVRVRFFEIARGERSFIQRQTLVSEGDQWYADGKRTQPFGWLLVYAHHSEVVVDFNFACDRWVCSVPTEDGPTTVTTADIFESGRVAWLVPTEMRRLGPNQVELRASCEFGELVAVWSLPEGASEPLVECRFKANRAGAYSLGMFSGPETDLKSVDYLLCGKPFLGRFIPPVSALVRENASSNGCSLMTLPLAGPAGGSSQATFGIAPDPDSVPFRWATAMDSVYGLGIRGSGGGVQTWLFAPLPGRPEGVLDAGDTFTFSYRPLFRIGGWYDMFRHVTDDILALRDVKKNYHSSLTDAIFNVQDLIMAEQKYSGWSDRAMAHAYCESWPVVNAFNHSSPLTLIQNYLITGDRDWYVRRAIPTMAFCLSRSAWTMMPYPGPGGGEPSALTGGPSGFPSSVYAGFYLMSRGRTPGYRPYGFPDEPAFWSMGRVNALFPEGVSLEFLEHLYRYRMTDEPEELARAEEGAEAYIDAFVRTAPTRQISHVGFEIMGTAPYLPALLSLYETTGKREYLDAAEEAGRRLIANSVWVQPRIPDGSVTIRADALKEAGFLHDPWHSGACVHGWNGSTRMILGYRFTDDVHGLRVPLVRTDAFDRIQDETVPAWLLSRVGLNVENSKQFSHRDIFRSPNITMNCYVADLIRLSRYTGDPFFETVARHETIGRAANYPGYYIDHFSTIYMKPDYPYKGPDVTAIEYTHFPPYLAKLQDFLISQAWSWSNEKIEFPWIRQYAYAYFDNRMYGFEPGRFFDEDGMWLWLKRGLIEVDDMQIDWLGARRDGLFAAALMNEDAQPAEVTVTLGEEIAGQGSLPRVATVYSATGRRSEKPIENGLLTVTVPPKGLVGFSVKSESVHSPRFASPGPIDYLGKDLEQTVALPRGDDDFSTGYVLQIDPDSWFAYTFLSDTPSEIQSATLHFRIGDGEWRSKRIDNYPFDHLEEVQGGADTFSFYWVIEDATGQKRQSREKHLRAL
ncbi:hypothetical protein HQ520_11315 [bacterium]|nr:hypothetical protein [bacterium]